MDEALVRGRIGHVKISRVDLIAPAVSHQTGKHVLANCAISSILNATSHHSKPVNTVDMPKAELDRIDSCIIAELQVAPGLSNRLGIAFPPAIHRAGRPRYRAVISTPADARELR